ncbi:hypothetical protein V6Z12_D06G092100 [Gossypium hirsutum]
MAQSSHFQHSYLHNINFHNPQKECNLGLNRRKRKQLGQIKERSKEGGPK